jgi:hypothetical protein
MPHTDVQRGTELMFRHTPQIPAWVQFPKRSPLENMMVQFTEGLPGLSLKDDRAAFDMSADGFVDELTEFYDHYLGAVERGDREALEHFGLTREFAAGFEVMIGRLRDHLDLQDAFMLKGQVTGPFTLGTNLLDETGRCSYYDAQLRDVIVKSIELKSLWQLDRLGAFGLPAMIFLDEPSLLGFGSQTFITIGREDVTRDINAVVRAIHSKGGLAGVHCEANTDWSLLMETQLDILDFDAYDHMQSITLYPAEMHTFLARGGWLGWGIVPTLDREAAGSETLEALLKRFDDGVQLLVNKGFDRDLIMRRALITPSCGAGGVLSEDLTARVLELLQQLSETLRMREGYC